jgi:hypothetical protein
MDMASFAGGMGGGLQSGANQAMQGIMLKKMMTGAQQPPLAPGYEDPSQQMSVAGPADFASLQQQPGIMDMLKKIMMFGGGGQ